MPFSECCHKYCGEVSQPSQKIILHQKLGCMYNLVIQPVIQPFSMKGNVSIFLGRNYPMNLFPRTVLAVF